MQDFSNIKDHLSQVEALEKELHLKQLQINRLLNITQAINNNVPAEGLFDMYKSFLSWEIGVKKMALYIRGEEGWSCKRHLGIDEELLNEDIHYYFTQYDRLQNLEEADHPLIQEFDVVIPVRHKKTPIAYVFIGGFTEDEDMYNKVQFITTITNVIAVAIENKRLFKRQLEQERLRKEMELASEVQSMLMPKRMPQNESYEFARIYKPHLGVGGDYYDFIEFPDNKLVFCVGDFTGKGVSAALLMANFQANFHTLINKRTSLDCFVRDLNNSVNLITKGERFITFFIAEYDVQTQRLRYINAGHNPPVLVTGGQAHLLEKGTIMLGSYQELPEVHVGCCDIKGEALIFSYTDGLTEVKNEAGRFLSEDLLYGFVKDNYALSAETFNQRLMGYLNNFKGATNYLDDFTVLTCRIFDPASERPD